MVLPREVVVVVVLMPCTSGSPMESTATKCGDPAVSNLFAMVDCKETGV